ncbi:MAG: site-specific integrase [Gammaproteobacteria bacterium]|nr:site-specific integrase [Gammaproteobacteria bacterium]
MLMLIDNEKLALLLQVNDDPEFGVRNRALILMASCLGLTMQELSVVRLLDVFTTEGNLRPILTVEAGVAQNHKSRRIPISHPILCEALGKHFDWRRKRDAIEDEDGEPGLAMASALFLNRKNKPYRLHKRRGTPGYLPAGIREELAGFLEKAGIDATPSIFRNSFVVECSRRGLNVGAIQELTGFSKRESVVTILNAHPPKMKDSLSQLYGGN